MRRFKVLLRDSKEEYVEAQRYRREDDKYVFENDGDDEVQFFLQSEVVGIFVVPPPPPPPEPLGEGEYSDPS